MQRINEDAVVTIVSGHGVNVNGFSEGDPTVPRQGTQISADFMNQVQEEIASVIEEAGLTLDGTLEQLLAGIRIVALDTSGGIGQTVAQRKVFQDGLTVSRTTPNSTAVAGTGSGSGAGLQAFGGAGTTTAGPGLLSNGGAPTGSSGNAGKGATVSGGSFNAGGTGNTTGAAGIGLDLSGGNIIADANGRAGGVGLQVSGGLATTRGNAIQTGGGDVVIGSGGNLSVAGATTCTGVINANGGIAMAAPTTIASMPGGFLNSWADGHALSSGAVPGAWVDAQGMKHIRGEISHSGAGSGSPVKAFTLDTPFRPAAAFSVWAVNAAGSFGANALALIDVEANGDVFITYAAGAGSANIFLECIPPYL